jgi:hypothetical protein
LGTNDSVTVAGFRIPGLVYCGRNLRAINGYDVEPALIDPSQAVAQSTAGFNPDSIPYWPSYSSIEPAARLAYLKWHASGRSAADAAISFVFLYFYGLERRVLYDYGSTTERGEEYRLILDEVRRLLSIYGGNSSFRRYASVFLEMAESVHLTVDTDGPPPDYPLRFHPPGPAHGSLPIPYFLDALHFRNAMGISGSCSRSGIERSGAPGLQ